MSVTDSSEIGRALAGFKRARTVTCVECGQRFTSRASVVFYCSPSCRERHLRRRHRRGELIPSKHKEAQE